MPDNFNTLLESLSKSTGVNPSDTKKIVEQLGLSAAYKEVEKSSGPERAQKLTLGEMKIAFRLGKSSICV
jgi:hypothetical protein